MARRTGWLAASLMALGACAIDEAVDPPRQGASSQAVGTGPCPDAGCGENSPVVGALGFHELSLIGAINKEGFAISALINGRAQIRKGARTYDLNVLNGKITGSTSGVTTLSGLGLVGAWIPIMRGAEGYTLRIGAVRSMPFFVEPRTPLIEAYKLEWFRNGDPEHPLNVCNSIQLLLDEGHGDPGAYQPELMAMMYWEAVVFEGDRISSHFKTMSNVADDRWFNIGCAGSVLSKLFLTRHTIHTQSPGPRAWEQRQATLKMYVADYCGTGDSFTVSRQKLVWQSPTVPYRLPPWKLEARWGPSGATCLNLPRMLYPSTPLGESQFPDIWDTLSRASCSPPICMNLDPYDYDGADRVSANLEPLP